jgi:hypothetical protein
MDYKLRQTATRSAAFRQKGSPYLWQMPESTRSLAERPSWLCLLFASFLLQSGVVRAQHPPMKDVTDSMNMLFPRLKSEWGANKTMPASLEKQIFFALSYFPEFKNTRIQFKLEKDDNGIISTRPTWGSVFRRSAKRTYIVVMADSSAARGSFPIFSNAPANGQVGILCHELCHVLYFRRHTGVGLIGLGINHISKKYMDGFENRTDSVDIERGLGWQLIAWNVYLRKAFGSKHPEGEPSPFDAPAKRERYMRPATIRKFMASRAIYKETLSQ